MRYHMDMKSTPQKSVVRFKAISMAAPAFGGCLVRAKSLGLKMLMAPTHFGRQKIVMRRGDSSLAFAIDPNVGLKGAVICPNAEQIQMVSDLRAIGILLPA